MLQDALTPPKAVIRPHAMTMHGHTRIDNYYWLNERENPEVIAYLEAENQYADACLKHTEPLQEQLFKEITGRIKQDDNSVPVKIRDYYHYTRYEEGKEPLIYMHCPIIQQTF